MPSPGVDSWTMKQVAPLFDYQECGKGFLPAFANDEEIVVLTCRADYTHLTEESSTEELLEL